MIKHDTMFYKKNSGNINICIYKHIITNEITWRSRIFLSRVVATSHGKLFKFKLVKIIKIKFSPVTLALFG